MQYEAITSMKGCRMQSGGKLAVKNTEKAPNQSEHSLYFQGMDFKTVSYNPFQINKYRSIRYDVI